VNSKSISRSSWWWDFTISFLFGNN